MIKRRSMVYGLLATAWITIVGWQIVEHLRVREAERTALVYRARDITTTLGLVIRSQRRFGLVFQEPLEAALNDLVKIGGLKSISVLNNAGAVVASAGEAMDHGVTNNFQAGAKWGKSTVTLANLVDLGAGGFPESDSARPIIVVPRNDSTNRPSGEWRGPRRPRWRSGDRDGTNAPPDFLSTNSPESRPAPPPPEEMDFPGPRPREGRPSFGRPPWMKEEEYRKLLEQRGLHSFVVVMSTESLRGAGTYDLWLRSIIGMFSGLAAVGLALAWRSVGKSSELQLRLMRASELNNHLKEMNIAAAGLAHETRNPLNIIRGLAQMISKQADASPETRLKTREIADEVDRVAAQLNEFINYSRPREVRLAPVRLDALIGEVARTLQYDLEDKQIELKVVENGLTIEADEQLLRQVLFNLLLNATQAVDIGGRIQILTQPSGAGDAMIEVRDDGIGVPETQRSEIFKPYFTTHQKGTGLGLAVVQQIVLAHGWEVVCLGNEPKGAIFRLSHLKRSPLPSSS